MSDDEMDIDEELRREQALEKKPKGKSAASPPPPAAEKEKQKEKQRSGGGGGGGGAGVNPFGQMMAAGRNMKDQAPVEVDHEHDENGDADAHGHGHGDKKSPTGGITSSSSSSSSKKQRDAMEVDDDDNDSDDDAPGAVFGMAATSTGGKGKGKEKAPASVTLATGGTGAMVASRETLPWVEKYRPQTMAEIVSHQDIVAVLERFIKTKSLPHLLFHGPPGTGKTSLILTIARQLYGPKFNAMTLELNASDDRGIDVVRNEIKEFASTRTIFSADFKLIILDEADAMTNAAQAALRRVIEKYTKNVRFCLICNYVSKIIPALQSRCTRFRFAPLNPDLVKTRLNEVIAAEKVTIDAQGIDALLRLSAGDMRKTLNILQATTAAFGTVTEEAVYLTTGSPLPADIERIVVWLLNEDFKTGFTSNPPPHPPFPLPPSPVSPSPVSLLCFLAMLFPPHHRRNHAAQN